MAKITAVIPGDDYLLTVRLDNGHAVTIDVRAKLHTARFAELRDRQAFRAAQTDGRAVYWPGGLSMAISEIMEIAGK